MEFLAGVVLAVSLSAAGAPIELGVRGRSNATPSIGADGNFVTIAWGAPVRVNDMDGGARLNGEQPPRVAVHHTTITIVWTAKGASGTKLVQSRSEEGGRTFAKTTAVPGGDAAGNRGWDNAVADRNGRVYAVWLDHRELAQQDAQVAASHHDHTAHAAGAPAGSADQKPDGVAMAQRSKLYLASLDGAVPPRAITSGKTFAAPLRVSEDKWVLEGCPDDGPAMAVDAKNRIHIVWPTLIKEGAGEQTIALFYAMSADGKRFTPRKRIPTEGMPHHPRVAVSPDGSLTAAWDELANGPRRIAVGRGIAADGGHSRFRREVLTTSGSAIYPALAVVGDGVVAVWTSGASASSSIQVARLAGLRSAATDR
jgi:hypothetical protein